MNYTVKGIKDIRESNTKYGSKKVYKIVISDSGGNEYPISVWNEVKVGDPIEGELGAYDPKYGEYKFTKKGGYSAPATVAKPADNSEFIENQNRIARESVVSSIATLFANRKDISEGEFFQFVEQGIAVVFHKPMILFCSADQRKAIVAIFGNEEKAHEYVYKVYYKPYLHLLTYDEAEDVIKNAKA